MPALPKLPHHREASGRARRTGTVARLEGRPVSDSELVERALRGDAWAEEAIFRRYVADITTLAERLLRRRHEADDVVQETFADAFLLLSRLRDPSALRSWLNGIAVRRVRRRARKLALLRAIGLDRGLDDRALELLVAPGLSPEDQLALTRIGEALDRLGTNDRIAWMLRHVEGETLESVASIMGFSLATVKRRIAHADALVRKELGEVSA